MMAPSGIISRLTRRRYRSRTEDGHNRLLILSPLALLVSIKRHINYLCASWQSAPLFEFTVQSMFTGQILAQFSSQLVLTGVFIDMQLFLFPISLYRLD